MRQFSQEMKKGNMQVEEVPPPAMRRGGVIVQNHFSLISAGTERSSVLKRKGGLLNKAKSNPEMVKLVLQQVKQQGLLKTYKKVMTKLEAYAPLGYSSAGTVVAVAHDVDDFSVGDRVSCGGNTANHAELIFVPKNLCAKVPAEVSFEEAAYTTVGAIALQGVRQAAPTLGETIVVIGLGLVGQITIQILKSAGCRVVGIDVDPRAVSLARVLGADAAFRRPTPGVVAEIRSRANGYGADATIITAATKSSDPVQLAGEISRDKGRVVVVGDVGITLPRAPYYMKELDFRLSRSYGPGRYDRTYEEQGYDYPIGYVRWTERRNMEEFLRLVQEKKVDVRKLTTHVFKIEDAVVAYRMISKRSPERYIGVLLEYPRKKRGIEKSVSVHPPRVEKTPLAVGFIGAGNFAQSSLIPYLDKATLSLKGVCTSNGLNAKNVARQFGFEFATTDAKEIYASDAVDAVFIATRHNLHAPLCIQALKHHKHVFVEKPLALNEAELDDIIKVRKASAKRSHLRLMVGYNRRFSPSAREVKYFFAESSEPMLINYRVNAGFLPRDHWTQDPVEGGGRIIGEICHFVDLIQFFTGGQPVRVFAQTLSLSGNQTQTDNVAITLRMSNGGIGVITYVANGDAAVPKEKVEVFCAGRTAIIDNFKSVESYQGSTRKISETPTIEKGHKEEMSAFIDSIHSGYELIEFDSLVATTRATFKIIESLETGLPVEL